MADMTYKSGTVEDALYPGPYEATDIGGSLPKLENNALITEEQINYVTKDVRDYIDSVTSNIEENYVAYTPQSPNRDQQTQARRNIEAYGLPDKEQFEGAQAKLASRIEALEQAISGMNLSISVQDILGIKDLIDDGADVFFLSDRAKIDSNGNLPIVSEYFPEVNKKEFFYNKNNTYPFQEWFATIDQQTPFIETIDQLKEVYPNATILNYGTMGENGLNWGVQVKDTTTNPSSLTTDPMALSSLLFLFGAYTSSGRSKDYYGLAAEEPNFEPDDIKKFKEPSVRSFTQEYHYAYSNFIPKALRAVKEGTIFYQESTGKIFKVTKAAKNKEVPITLMGKNQSGEEGTLYGGMDEEKNHICGKLAPTCPTKTEYAQLLKNHINSGNNPINYYEYESRRYLYTLLSLSKFADIKSEYPWGAMAFHCELIGTLPSWTLWEYKGEVLFGGGLEYPDNLRKMSYLGSGSRPQAWVGDYIYNPQSQQLMRVIRNLCKSETCDAETYLTEPVWTYAPTEGESSRLFMGGSTTKGLSWRFFIEPGVDESFDKKLEDYYTDDLTTFSQYTTLQTLKQEYRYLSKNESYGSSDVINIHGTRLNDLDSYEFNTYFLLPYEFRRYKEINSVRYAQLCGAQEGDIIIDNNFVFQIKSRPHLKDFSDVEKSNLITYYSKKEKLTNREEMLYDLLKNGKLNNSKTYGLSDMAQNYRSLHSKEEIYDKDLYYRLLSNMQRPIIVEAIKLNVMFNGGKGDAGRDGIDGKDALEAAIEAGIVPPDSTWKDLIALTASSSFYSLSEVKAILLNATSERYEVLLDDITSIKEVIKIKDIIAIRKLVNKNNTSQIYAQNAWMYVSDKTDNKIILTLSQTLPTVAQIDSAQIDEIVKGILTGQNLYGTNVYGGNFYGTKYEGAKLLLDNSYLDVAEAKLRAAAERDQISSDLVNNYITQMEQIRSLPYIQAQKSTYNPNAQNERDIITEEDVFFKVDEDGVYIKGKSLIIDDPTILRFKCDKISRSVSIEDLEQWTAEVSLETPMSSTNPILQNYEKILITFNEKINDTFEKNQWLTSNLTVVNGSREDNKANYFPINRIKFKDFNAQTGGKIINSLGHPILTSKSNHTNSLRTHGQVYLVGPNEQLTFRQGVAGGYVVWIPNGDFTATTISGDSITTGTINANLVDTENLSVNLANVYGILTADNIDVTTIKIGEANINGKLTANVIDGKNLKVKAANVEGVLTADKIDASNLVVKEAATITGKLSAKKIDVDGIETTNLTIKTNYGTLTAGKGSAGSNITTQGIQLRVKDKDTNKYNNVIVTDHGVRLTYEGREDGDSSSASNYLYLNRDNIVIKKGILLDETNAIIKPYETSTNYSIGTATRHAKGLQIISPSSTDSKTLFRLCITEIGIFTQKSTNNGSSWTNANYIQN